MSTLVVIGLDGEMSGNDIDAGCGLIQAGFAAWVDDRLEVFSALCNPGPALWQPKAQAIHGISPAAIAAAPSTTDVDERAAQWLGSRGGRPGTRSSVIAVGFNVGAFDVPFFRRYLPETMSMVSRRSIDLNAICFMLAGWDPRGGDQARDWTGWRRSAKKYASDRLADLAVPGAAHDAGWDAAEALLAYLWLRDQVHQCRITDQVAAEPSHDPVTAVLGTRLRANLRDLPEDDLAGLALAYSAARIATTGIAPGKWFGTRRAEFGGRTALQAIQDGDFDLVHRHLAAATEAPSANNEIVVGDTPAEQPLNFELSQINRDPNPYAGAASIGDTGILVTLILGHLAHGRSVPQILKLLPELTNEDVLAAITWARRAVIDTDLRWREHWESVGLVKLTTWQRANLNARLHNLADPEPKIGSLQGQPLPPADPNNFIRLSEGGIADMFHPPEGQATTND